jgi:hypothetical protein
MAETLEPFNFEDNLNKPMLIIWNTCQNLDMPFRSRVELLPYSKNATDALVMALQYFMKHTECEIISVSSTPGSARIGINWDDESWTEVIIESGVRAMNLDLERKVMAAKAKPAESQ